MTVVHIGRYRPTRYLSGRAYPLPECVAYYHSAMHFGMSMGLVPNAKG